MPELPDVEIVRRRIAQGWLHRTLDEVAIRGRRLVAGDTAARVAQALTGASFTAAGRHGKHLLLGLSSGGVLGLHFGLTGELGDEDDAATRLVLRFTDGGTLALRDPRQLARLSLAPDAATYIAAHGLGPDALTIDAVTWTNGLAGRGGAIKPALMDQAFVAGIGNVVADELLFQARLHPLTVPRDLGLAALRRLHPLLQRILATAIERGAGSGRLPKGWLMPVRRAGAPCPRCGEPLAVITVGGRTTMLCPREQTVPETATIRVAARAARRAPHARVRK